jgi:NAD(P)-dependent dehydrogenase (short-subunit alcohol dehydrogenase family)
MKIASQWYRQGLGAALGYLVGALVIGSASAHGLRALADALPWHSIMLGVAALAALGGLLILTLGEPPQAQARVTTLQWQALGALCWIYKADLADMAGCDALLQAVLAEHGQVDILVNNAGRSIRRSIELSYDRFHDYERTMQLNYFGCLRVTMGFLPGMVEKRKGHVVNISSIGVLTNAPRFSAYVASKAALDAWTRCASSEFADQGITFTTINMPLVRTPMIAPTNIYNNVPTLSPEEAADMVAQACIFKPVRIATRLGITGQILHALMPRVAQISMNTSFRMFPDSTAAKGDKNAKPQLSAEAVALQQMMRGIHF